MKKKYGLIILVILVVLGAGLLVYRHYAYLIGWANPLHVIFKPHYYTNEDLGIPVLVSPNDKDLDGIDDYQDILLGAQKEAARAPHYDSAYFAGGYPPETIGVCTDLVWRALMEAGYVLKDEVDEDIRLHPELYPYALNRDANIDFRRVVNLSVFFRRHAESLTLDLEDTGAWQAGDIVIFGDEHIGILSDKRNASGIPYMLHNDGVFDFEDNSLKLWHEAVPISGHYRWNP